MATSALVIDNGLACLEASAAVLHSVLAATRASPLAPLGINATVSHGVPCSSLNYTRQKKGADECFAPASLHYRPKSLPPYDPSVPHTEDINLFEADSESAGLLTTYDYLHDLPNGTATLRSKCVCFTGSAVCNRLAQGACKAAAAANCNRTADADAEADADAPAEAPGADATSAVVARARRLLPPSAPRLVPPSAPPLAVGSHVPDAGLLCNEGPIEFMTTVMVARLKSGSLGALHQADGVRANVTCAARGFVTQLNPGTPDHCYPPATLWHRPVDIFDLYRMEWLEDGAFLAYDAAKPGRTPGAGYKVAVCDCLPSSAVRRGLPPGFC